MMAEQCACPDAFDPILSAFIDNFLKPGNLAGGFAHYRASHVGRPSLRHRAHRPPILTRPRH